MFGLVRARRTTSVATTMAGLGVAMVGGTTWARVPSLLRTVSSEEAMENGAGVGVVKIVVVYTVARRDLGEIPGGVKDAFLEVGSNTCLLLEIFLFAFGIVFVGLLGVLFLFAFFGFDFTLFIIKGCGRETFRKIHSCRFSKIMNTGFAPIWVLGEGSKFVAEFFKIRAQAHDEFSLEVSLSAGVAVCVKEAEFTNQRFDIGINQLAETSKHRLKVLVAFVQGALG